MADETLADLSSLTADIVAAYVSNNRVGIDMLAKLIADTHQALSAAGAPAPSQPETPKPDKAAIRKSVQPDALTSFLDGRPYKSLKRHLNTYGLSPDEYRTRFGLAKDYPMVASSYSAQRSALAKSLGLGRKAAGRTATPAEKTAADPAAAGKPARAKRPKAIKPSGETST